MKNKPDLSFWKLWNLSFGFFGVQIAYALQSSQVSRIFSTIGADPHDLSFFWILPPLMGLIVQPIVGVASDKTWNRFGRRLPYLLIGAAVAIIVMSLLPNSGSLGLAVSQAIVFGLVMLMLLDTSINMAMQPFKMLVGDFVNEKQKGLAYSIQSFLCNAGSVVGYIAPIVLALFLSNTAPAGEVPPTVTWAFYIGAAILLLCVIYTFAKVKEMPPHEYAEYHGIKETSDGKQEKVGILKLLRTAPKVFWTVGVVQFFCWAGFLFMWSYSVDALAGQAFESPKTVTIEGVTVDGKDYCDKYVFNGERPVVIEGRLALAGIEFDGTFSVPQTVAVVRNDTVMDTIVANGQVVYENGVAKAALSATERSEIAKAGDVLVIDGGQPTAVLSSVVSISEYSLIEPGTALTLAHRVNKDNTGRYELHETSEIPAASSLDKMQLKHKTVLNAASEEYQEAGNWNGVLLALQGLAAVVWALVLPRFRSRRLGYSISLVLGGIGFLMVSMISNQWLLILPYALMGCAWAAMLAMPFTILTNALSGGNIGTYLGLFNCTITVPQIVASILGGLIVPFIPVIGDALPGAGAPATVYMLSASGVMLLLGAAAVWIIKETYASQESAK